MSQPIQSKDSQTIPIITRGDKPRQEGCWKRGEEVVVTPKNIRIPGYCFKCGKPTTLLKRKSVHWQKPWTYFLGELGALARKDAVVFLPICELHRKKYSVLVRLGWLCVAAMLPLILIGCMMLGHESTDQLGCILIIGSPACVIAATVFFVKGNLPVQTTCIDSNFVTLKGAGKEFLEKLEEI